MVQSEILSLQSGRVVLSLVLAFAIVADRGCGTAAAVIKSPRVVSSSLLFRMNKSSLGMARIDEAIPLDDCPYALCNANTFVRARAYRVFQPRMLGSTSGHPLRPLAPSGCPF